MGKYSSRVAQCHHIFFANKQNRYSKQSRHSLGLCLRLTVISITESNRGISDYNGSWNQYSSCGIREIWSDMMCHEFLYHFIIRITVTIILLSFFFQSLFSPSRTISIKMTQAQVNKQIGVRLNVKICFQLCVYQRYFRIWAKQMQINKRHLSS